MKTVTAIVMVSVMSLSGAALASPHGNGCGKYDENRVEKRVEKMSKRLDLSADQKQQVEALTTTHHQNMSAMRESMRAMHESFNNDIAKLLNSEQKQTFQKIQDKRKAKREAKCEDKHEA